ncbi:hypothetical protein K0B96_01715 [Horticoccus luteus]|uniref:Uncharacterized protein n=1 Tax=Horticoccus luteus TaxID=2862869 RepID=A0A8F9XLM0_9BACT|nr:hypothetical protein [Horticoccus luteus]QYM79361.1 hypothetical protein K0B96_01715 [Horticoccus luteus]
MSAALPSSIVAEIEFVGRTGGLVKALSGFKKSHHTVPDAITPATQAFLGKLCAEELTEAGEALFQAVRSGLNYKRKDVSLSLSSPGAVLTAKDFSVELAYALEAGDPARYTLTQWLRELRNAELAETEEFAAIFAGKFSEISFALKKGVRVEAVIDIIEALDDEAGMSVTYPSDCAECVIAVAGVDAQVRCTGASLDVVFTRGGSPRELIAGFAAVRDAFSISRELAGLIG